MFSQQDIEQIQQKGSTEAQIQGQLNRFNTGFPFLKVTGAANVGHGVVYLNEDQEVEAQNIWKQYLAEGGTVEKFTPASGAASRMFKNMFAFLNADYDIPTTDFEKEFFAGIDKFAFKEAIDKKAKENYGMTTNELIAEGRYKDVAKMLLKEEGLNYGALPKGVLQFHKLNGVVHTALEEHLEEGAQYAAGNDGVVNLHFTVSPEHRALFEALIAEKVPQFEQQYSVKYNITMSEQKKSTDTIAVNMDNTPFRNADGSLLFRPAGHGALIENLNERTADVIFIKNIDNVVPGNKRVSTIKYKKVLGGYLIHIQKQIKEYMTMLDSGNYTMDDLMKMVRFLHEKLFTRYDDMKTLEDSELAVYLRGKFNRPIRVCGMVRNDGEPGGGPFIALNKDGSTSPQILESSQFDSNDPVSKDMMKMASHFNPVDLVCYIKDYKGEKFDLPKYVDSDTGFISEKSKDGKELKALELPGLWNGSMSDWCTVFVEVPAATFNPVKTVNDLLRVMHQG